MKSVAKFLLSGILIGLSMPAVAAVPFTIASGLFDQSDPIRLGLSLLENTETVTVFAPVDTTDHFSHGVVMIGFKGSLYCMWQSSATTEDSPDTWVAYSRSEDEGQTWTKPMVLCPTIENGYCSSGGWWATEDTLVAYINTWPAELNPKGGYVRYMTSVDGLTWSEPAEVLMSDGSRLNGIFEQDPHALPDGRIVNSAHFQPGLHVCPIYTDDPLGIRGWTKGAFAYQDNGAQSVELEPSWFYQNDGTLVTIFRDQKSSYYKLASKSEDRGETWTKSEKTAMPDARTKQSAGNLPDGTAFMVGNPVNSSRRAPLVLTLSRDGKTFDTAWLLHEDYKPVPRYATKDKSVFSYPKSVIIGDYLYIAYAILKEDVQYTRVPLSAISLNTDALETPCDDEGMWQTASRLHFSLEGEAQVKVYALSGVCVWKESFRRSSFEVDLSTLPRGMYVVQWQTGEKSVSRLISL